MDIKLITPTMLAKLRRGAEHLFVKYREKLTTATVVVRQDIAKELGLKFKPSKSETVQVGNGFGKVGLFDDEPDLDTVESTPMTKVKLTDLIEALKKYKAQDPAQAAQKPNAS